MLRINKTVHNIRIKESAGSLIEIFVFFEEILTDILPAKLKIFFK